MPNTPTPKQVLYSRGTGTKRDAPQAAAWYLKASTQGHREAQVCYATCLYKGDGVPQDLSAAALLFQVL